MRVLSRDGRAAAPAVVARRRRVAFVLERDDTLRHRGRRRSTAARGRGASRTPTTRGIPTWSADGRTLAWHEWDLPNMPWDGSRIIAVAVDDPDAAPTLVAGGDDVAVGQPRFAPTGDALAFVAEPTAG